MWKLKAHERRDEVQTRAPADTLRVFVAEKGTKGVDIRWYDLQSTGEAGDLLLEEHYLNYLYPANINI